MLKGFKIRIYPTKEQEQKFWQHIGACRYIWNYMLDLQEKRYANGEKHLSAFGMTKMLYPLKNDGEHNWLYDVSHKSLQGACKDLEFAYQQFFKKAAKFPKFKSLKKSKPSYSVNYENFYFRDEKVLNIEKVGKVRYKTDFKFPFGWNVQKYYNVRVSFVNGKWMVSFAMECENQVPELTDKSMGIDLGVKDTAIVAIGDERIVFHNINKSKKMKALKQKQKHIYRSISRKYRQHGNYEKTNNIMKEEEKLRKLYAKEANIRHNYIHQMTYQLTSMLPYRVVMEDLNIQGMMKNKHLSRAVSEQCLYKIIRQMKYKCEWNGIEFVQASRWFPSSKTCSCCGSIKEDLKLSDRTYRCDVCGLEIDRDYNAALNLSRYVA